MRCGFRPLAWERGRGTIKTRSYKNPSSLSDPFRDQARSWDEPPPATDAFLQLAHVGLLFFSDGTTVRHAQQLLGFVAQLLAFDFAQTLDFRFKLLTLFLQLGILLGGFNQRETSIWWRIRSRRSLRRLISFFSTSFMTNNSENGEFTGKDTPM